EIAGAGVSCPCCHDCIRKPLPRRAASCHTHSTQKGLLLQLYALHRGASIAVCVAVPLYGLGGRLSTNPRSSSERHIFASAFWRSCRHCEQAARGGTSPRRVPPPGEWRRDHDSTLSIISRSLKRQNPSFVRHSRARGWIRWRPSCRTYARHLP